MFYIWNKMYDVNVHLSSLYPRRMGGFHPLLIYKYVRMREISSVFSSDPWGDGGRSAIASAFNEDRTRI